MFLVEQKIIIINFSLDCASKAALLAYSDSVRAELFAHKNIHVSTVNPGYVNTNVSVNALTSDGHKNNQNDALHEEGFSTQYVSWQIINAILNKSNEVLVDIPLHRVGIWLRFFFPSLFFWMMSVRAERILQNNFQD
jgi:dehydrogenase/reductase SDR family protein 7B